MSSPRKYSSPYLMGLPGLANSGTSPKLKKRSKTSITKTNTYFDNNPEDKCATSNSENNNAVVLDSQASSFDQSSGDDVVNKVLKEMKETAVDEVYPTITSQEEGNSDATKMDNEKQDEESPEPLCTGAGAQEVEEATISTSTNTNIEEVVEYCNSSSQQLLSETQQLSSTNNNEWKDEKPEESVEPRELLPAPTTSLKSILKIPSPYIKYKSKPTKPEACIEVVGSVKKSHHHHHHSKSPKMKSGKLSSRDRDREKETKEKEYPTRSLTKHKPGGLGLQGAAIVAGAGASASLSKIELFHQQQAFATKSPRRKSKATSTHGKSADKLGEIPAPPPRKSVRFSNRIDVYPVPYEARAGSRACDWQRNMLEQRVQTFRQLMKDVGSEDLEMFGGSGMIFPGYPYHLPNPNYAAARGRVRNYKF